MIGKLAASLNLVEENSELSALDLVNELKNNKLKVLNIEGTLLQKTEKLKNLLSSHEEGLTGISELEFIFDKIQNIVSNYFNIPLSDMLSQRRSRPLARPRQIAMYLAKKMTTRSLPEIGRRFANRDHTTVIHAVKTINRLSEQDDEMKKNITQIKSLLLE